MKLASKITLLIVALSILFSISFWLMLNGFVQKRLIATQDDWVNTVAHTIVEGISLDTINGDVIHAQDTLRNIVHVEAAFEYAYVVDFDNQFFSHSFIHEVPGFIHKIDHETHANNLSRQRYQTNEDVIIDVVYPLIEGLPAHLHVGVNQKEIHGILRDTQSVLVVVGIVVSTIGIALALYIGRRMTQPLSRLANEMRAYGGGNSRRERLSGHNDTEVRQLTLAFDDMTDARNRAELALQEHRDHLEELVQERTKDLAKARDQALQATRVKSEFLASMSHELRTPLNSIIGFTGIIKDGIAGPVNEEQSKQLQMVYGSAKHLLELINDILDLSKVEAGKVEVVKEKFNINSFLSELDLLMRPQVQEKGITYEHKTTETNCIIFTDNAKLHHILVNLLSNAVKFTDQGSVTLEFRRQGEDALFIVSDTGIGINRNNLHKIFDAFQQVDGSDTRQHQGTGLGLAISKQFVTLLGGELEVESEAGSGSTFHFTLPGVIVEESVTITTSKPVFSQTVKAPEDIKTDGGLVLVIEDQKESLELLRNYLLREGYQVIPCGDGRDAVKLARKHRPFAITLDIVMPKQDGWTTLAQLKEDPLTSDIPVVIVSTLSESNLGLSLGAVEYLQKPIDPDQLLFFLRGMQLTGKDILIVEDHAQDAELLRAILEPCGYRVQIATNGAGALSLINKAMPDLLLLDLMMPDMSGFEVVRRLKGATPTRDIPIIVVSAKQLSEAESQFLRNNVENTLVKGHFTHEQMLAETSNALHKLKEPVIKS